MQLQEGAVDPRSCLFRINILLSGNYYGKDFFFCKHVAEQPQREQERALRRSFHRTAACSRAWMPGRLVRRQSRGGDERGVLPSEGECVSRIGARAASSSWSPAAMAVTRTSSSAELMASDKCVMGELSEPEVHGSSFYESETPYECFTVFCSDCLSYDHWAGACITVPVGIVLSP